MQRGAIKKGSSKLLTLWVPESFVPAINQGVMLTDTDKSKFVRSAIREKFARLGIHLKEAA